MYTLRASIDNIEVKQRERWREREREGEGGGEGEGEGEGEQREKRLSPLLLFVLYKLHLNYYNLNVLLSSVSPSFGSSKR